MKAKLIINDQELEVEISEEEYKKLQTTKKKKTGYERVKHDETYYSTSWVGTVGTNREVYDKIDDESYKIANYYSSREVAENNARADKLMRQLRRFAAEHRKDVIDWSDFNQYKYYVVYDYEDARIYVDCICYCSRFGSIYFNSKETTQLAIDTFHDELIWYFTEYKDSL